MQSFTRSIGLGTLGRKNISSFLLGGTLIIETGSNRASTARMLESSFAMISTKCLPYNIFRRQERSWDLQKKGRNQVCLGATFKG